MYTNVNQKKVQVIKNEKKKIPKLEENGNKEAELISE